MNKQEIYDTLSEIENNLAPCPICGDNAEIIAMHVTKHGIIIDSVGCNSCHLFANRKHLSRKIDVIQVWNNRTNFTKINNENYSVEEELLILSDIEKCVIRYATGYKREDADCSKIDKEEWYVKCRNYIRNRIHEIEK